VEVKATTLLPPLPPLFKARRPADPILDEEVEVVVLLLFCVAEEVK
jgi:hypothetical protein